MKKVVLSTIAVFLVGSFILGFTVTAKTTFKDISSSHWAKDEIDYLSTKKIINGYSNGNFGPNDSIKRVDAATMIVRALELDTSNRPSTDLYDVTKKSYGYDTIATVIDEGIFFGNNGYFYPNNTLTRAEMAAILNRAFQLEEKSSGVSFKDLDTKYWAYKDIQALAANNITSGYKDNTFKPNQTITRAEFSAFMSRILKNPNVIDNKEPVVNPPGTVENNGNTNNTDNQNFEVIQIY